MSDEYSSILVLVVMNATLLYLEYSLFQILGTLAVANDLESGPTVLFLLSLLALFLLSINFILLSLKSVKGDDYQSIQKIIAIIIVITIFILLFHLVMYTLGAVFDVL